MDMYNKSNSYNNQYKKYNGGYVTYFKLYPQIIKLTKIGMRKENFFQKLCSIIEVIFKTPYWLIIKPLFSIFHSKTKYTGNSYFWNDTLTNHTMKTSKTFYIMRVPFFYYKRKTKTYEVLALANNEDPTKKPSF